MPELGRPDRKMADDETVYIVDFENRTLEIVGGKDKTREDGYTYTISANGTFVNQITKGGFVEEVYDAHDSLEAIERLRSRP
jgi:hypothetical protein